MGEATIDAALASPAYHILSSARSILREHGLSLSVSNANKHHLVATAATPIYTRLRHQMRRLTGSAAPISSTESPKLSATPEVIVVGFDFGNGYFCAFCYHCKMNCW